MPYGIYVRQIVAGGAAARDGRLETGDQILAIANSPLIDRDQSEAVSILSKTTSDVPLVVSKQAAQARGIVNLIQAGGGDVGPSNPRPQPPPPSMLIPQQQPALRGALVNRQANMVRSTPDLNAVVSRQPRSVGESDDDSDDSDEDQSGAQFGSRILQTGVRHSRPEQQHRQQQPASSLYFELCANPAYELSVFPV